ncbi:MAG TPA: rhodanese-like domain-containing protein [Angustibacter sp.]|nr:rhodanese-like domain-containing protein [Angustibacter sp.]
MRRRAAIAITLAATLAVPTLAACGGGGDAPSLTSATAAVSAPASGSSLAPAQFAAAAKRPGTTLLDVRTPAEFAAGHLPGAVNVDVSSRDFLARLDQLDRAGTYAVYCHSGNRSAAALQMMAQAGFTSAYDLAGGLQAWQDAGGDVVTG